MLDTLRATSDMLVQPEQLAAAMSRLEIGDDTLVVAYDNIGPPAVAARLWWALSYYGHQRVQVLDGGLRNPVFQVSQISHNWGFPGKRLGAARPTCIRHSKSPKVLRQPLRGLLPDTANWKFLIVPVRDLYSNIIS